MSESERWTVNCQETSDGSGVVIVDLPPELLARLGLGLGYELTIEVVNGAIVLKPKQIHRPPPVLSLNPQDSLNSSRFTQTPAS